MIDEFIKKLEKEIQKNSEEAEKEEQLARLKEIAKVYSGEDQVISSEEIAKEIKSRPEETKYYSGYSGLDRILKGFRERQLVVISAATKSGKTSFCIDLTSKLSEQNPIWFPFEEGAEDIIQKFIDRNEDPPHFYTPRKTKEHTTNWIEEKIIESIAKFNTKIVFIDHLDFIVPFVGERHDLKVGETMRTLKSIANRWNVIIFLAAHIKKAQIDKHPSIEDLRGSASVAQEADTVLMMWREAKRRKGEVEITDNVNLSVQANRRTGSTGNVKMKYENGHFIEYDWTSAYDESIPL